MHIEALISAFLRADGNVVDLVGERVYTQLPSNPTYPAVRLHRYGGAPAGRPLWLDAALIHFDCWGDQKIEADHLSQEILAAMCERSIGAHDFTAAARGVITGAEPIVVAWTPDDRVSTPNGVARSRFVITMTVWAHPLPVVDAGS